MMQHEIIGVVPVRLGSTRFPDKVIYEIQGKPLFMLPVETLRKCERVSRVIVATDSEKIASIAEQYGVECFINENVCNCGTERVAEIALSNDCNYYINLQADEVLVQSWMIDLLIDRAQRLDAEMATITAPVIDETELDDSNTVKVVKDAKDKALYFSRCPIPFARHLHSQYRKHIGVYFLSRSTLELYSGQPVSSLEYAESLEQLRALEFGIDIHCVEIDEAAEIISINTKNDIVKLTNILNKQID